MDSFYYFTDNACANFVEISFVSFVTYLILFMFKEIVTHLLFRWDMFMRGSTGPAVYFHAVTKSIVRHFFSVTLTGLDIR